MSRTKVRFLGGAGQVTGSNFLLETETGSFLIDCGLFQGKESFEGANWEPFPFDVNSVSHLIVTHAHIDHIGRIPKLVRDGFKGKILSTEATRSLAHPLLLDSMELLRHTAERQGRPELYTEADIDAAMAQWEGIPYRKAVELPFAFALEFLNSSHILGAAMAKFSRGGRSIVFTGDLGGNSLLLPAIDIPHADYMVMESVYGDKDRGNEVEERHERLEDVIEETVARGGTLLIPAFSTERTQDLLYEIRTLMTQKRVPSVPVFVDSPLASKITQAFLANPSYFCDDIRARIEKGEDIFAFPELRFTEDVTASRAADAAKPPKILLAGSGMMSGGRVLEHELSVLPDEKSTLCIVGYQSAGSLGRQLLEGAKEVEIHRQKVQVRCKIETIFGFSAHLDGPHLLDFVSKVDGKLEKVFVTMGEPASAAFLAQRIQDYLGIQAVTPEAGEDVSIDL